MDIQFTVLTDSFQDNVILKILDFESYVDISSMDGKRTVCSNIKNVGVPVDINFLGDVSQVKFDMN